MAKKKHLNVPFIKSAVMFVLGGITGAIGALTGIGMQVSAAPTLGFMLGYSPEKQLGTAIAFALFASAAAAIGAGAGGLHIDTTIALIVALGAFVGVIFSARASAKSEFNTARRTAHTMGMALMVYVIGSAARILYGGELSFHHEWISGAAGFFVFGILAGAISSYLQISMAILIVPSLVFFGPLSPSHAVVTSLVVIAVASLLPALSHAAQGRIDRGPGFSMIIGGTLGGLAGGFVLAKWLSTSAISLIAFGLVAMFLSAYTLHRNS
jgi:uncharacterized membrane protein YfcA